MTFIEADFIAKLDQAEALINECDKAGLYYTCRETGAAYKLIEDARDMLPDNYPETRKYTQVCLDEWGYLTDFDESFVEEWIDQIYNGSLASWHGTFKQGLGMPRHCIDWYLPW